MDRENSALYLDPPYQALGIDKDIVTTRRLDLAWETMRQAPTVDHIYEWMVQCVFSQHEAGTLPSSWQMIDTTAGWLGMHADFLDIQRQYKNLSGADFTCKPMETEIVIRLCTEYLAAQKAGRLFHHAVYIKALEQLDLGEVKMIEEVIDRREPTLVPDGIRRPRLLCVPSYWDTPTLYEEYGVSRAAAEQIEPWYKVYEGGAVKASARHRTRTDGDSLDDSGIRRGHDAFSYWNRLGIEAGEEGIDAIRYDLLDTADHEGRGHFVIDKACVWLLGVSWSSAVYEGFTNAFVLSQRRELVGGAMSFQDFIECPGVLRSEGVAVDHQRAFMASYIAGAKFYRAVYNSMSNHTDDRLDAGTWSTIVASMLRMALHVGTSVDPDTPEVSRVALFHKALIADLGISIDAVEQAYEQLCIASNT